MNTQLLKLLILFVLISNISFAQNCKKLNQWTLSVEQEFPNVDYKKLKSGSDTYDRIRYNLLSDKYFIPIFKKPFDELSESKRSYINSVIGKCNPSKLGGGGLNDIFLKEYESIKRLNFYMWGVFIQNRAYEEAINNLHDLRRKRESYNQILDKIRSMNVTFHELEEYRNHGTADFYILMPSEQNKLSELISETETQLANQKLMEKADSISNLSENVSSLNGLQSFEHQNSNLYDKANSQHITLINNVKTDKTKKIFDALNEAIEKKPDDWKVYMSRGDAFYILKDYENAIADYNDCIRLNPQSNFQSLYMRAMANYQKQDYERAIEDLGKCIDLNPDEYKSFYLRAASYFNLGNYAKSLKDYDKAIELNSNQNWNLYFERGIANYNLDQYKEAIKDFSVIIRFDSNNSEAFFWRGKTYSQINENSLARKDLEIAYNLNPNNEIYNEALKSMNTKSNPTLFEGIVAVGLGLLMIEALTPDKSRNVKSSSGDYCGWCGNRGYKRCVSCSGRGYKIMFPTAATMSCGLCGGDGRTDCYSCNN